jgi:glycosyltransferase involved in cell wall biosynthesis
LTPQQDLSPRPPCRAFDVSIVGIVGLPGRYGGFETLADQLTQRIADRMRLQVFCTSKGRGHSLGDSYMGAHLSYVGWDANGWQSIVYDFVSLWRASPLSRTLLVLGVSGCLLLPLIRWHWPHLRIITNIDGLEWKRRKWGRLARWVLHLSEWMAVRFSHEVIADNRAIQQHVRQSYGRESRLIAYGGDHVVVHGEVATPAIRFAPGSYFLSICRIEPENNVREILRAFESTPDQKLVFVGNWNLSPYSRAVRMEFDGKSNIELLEPVYEPVCLAGLRRGARAYVHGHSAGGTNPSLVEAMSMGMAVLAYDVVYNRHTTDSAAVYWSDSESLARLLSTLNDESLLRNAQSMARLAAERYTWNYVAEQYRSLLCYPTVHDGVEKEAR